MTIVQGDYSSFELWRASRAGDREALGDLIARHLAALRAFVRLRMSPLLRAHESESDLVQSTCRELLMGLDDFDDRGEDAFRGWLFTALHNKLRKKERDLRRQKRDARREQPLDLGATGDDRQIAALYRTALSPSQEVMGEETARLLERVFDELPEAYREVLILSRIARLPRAEIAARMGRSEGSIRNLLTRALVELSKRLDQRGSTAGPGADPP